MRFWAQKEQLQLRTKSPIIYLEGRARCQGQNRDNSMTAYKTIRKNATKKIQSILNSAVGIIGRVSSMQIDDSYENDYHLATAEEVIAWLKDENNYHDATCFYRDDEFNVSGPYHFCDHFTAYFNQEALNEALECYGLAESINAPQESLEAVKAESNVIAVDFTRRVRLSA
ncbi:hypothetical protein QYZ44_26680 [Vibrio parahaemolyticus]|nr:hypothetical protein [Vibrio parahaemolyticus]MDN4712304.1 hypothetical protein [Vibrio parahaemolyticus]